MRCVPRIVTGGPWQEAGERGKEVPQRPGDDRSRCSRSRRKTL